MKRLLFIIFLLLVILLYTSISFSWFIENNNTKVNDFILPVSESDNIEISEDGVTYSNKINIDNNTNLKCVSFGNDNFYSPIFSITKVNKSYKSSLRDLDIIEEEDLNSYLFSDEFYIKSSLDKRIGIDFNNFIINTNNVINSKNYNCNILTGAIRIAIYQYINNKYELKLIIFPNANYEMNDNVFNYEGSIEESYCFYNSANINDKYFISTESNNFVNNNISYLWNINDIGKYYFSNVKSGSNLFKIFIWLDGTDRECNDLLINDTNNDLFLNFSLKFVFDN